MPLTPPMAAALELVRGGSTATAAAKACGVSISRLCEVARRDGLRLPCGRPRQSYVQTSPSAIAAQLRVDGLSMRDAAQATGISKNAVRRALLRRFGGTP